MIITQLSGTDCVLGPIWPRMDRASAGRGMKTMSAKDAKYGFRRLMDLAPAERVAVAKHGRPVVAVMAGKEHVRLRALRQETTIIAKSRPGRSNGSSNPQHSLLHPWLLGQPRVAFPFDTAQSAAFSGSQRSESPRWR